VVSFTVILFVLVLQFLAKYMEDLFGKGIDSAVLGKIFLYSCMTLVPLAIPLGVLLASLLTMGNLGERYELAAMKSSGIGLFRTMAPLINVTILTTLFSLVFSFYIMPGSNLKLYTLLFDVSNVKPTFALKGGHFYNGVDGMVIHSTSIDREADLVYGIKIFDHSDQVGNNRITLAERGKMVQSKESGQLLMTLWDGVIHESLIKNPNDKKKNQYQRFYFDTLQYKVALSGFDLEKSDENTFANHHYMLNILELYAAVDSMYGRTDKYIEDLENYVIKYVHLDSTAEETQLDKLRQDSIRRDSLARDSVPGKKFMKGPQGDSMVRHAAVADTTDFGPDGKIEPDTAKAIYAWFPDLDPEELVNKAIQQARSVKNYAGIIMDRVDREGLKIRKFEIEVNNRWMLPTSCLVFLFLGAPLGAIIRKGGIGLPVIFSILFFILFYILMIQGKKFARDEIMPIWAGVWLPILVMAPLALFFTYQSATDSKVLYTQSWYTLYRKTLGRLPFLRKKNKEPDRSTMSIEEMIIRRERDKTNAREAIEEAEKLKKR
jgi:lipopolysaccharide export system permease protein